MTQETTIPGYAGTRTRWYTLDGQHLTIRQLATMAGCPYNAMATRLRYHEPAEAVAMGAASRSANARSAHLVKHQFPLKRKPLPERPEFPPKPVRAEKQKEPKPDVMKRHQIGDEMLTTRQLAERAGCCYDTMADRLRRMTPERALKLGGPRQNRPRTDDWQRRIKPGSKLDALTQPKQAGPVGEIIVPKGVKRTVAPPIPERFAVDPKKLMFSFGLIGEYAVCSGWAEAVAARIG